MQTSEKSFLNNNFSHIYVEKAAEAYPKTLEILSHFKNSNIIYIDHYKDVFCRKHQNFSLQKKSMNLILSVKKDNLIYKGSQMCEDFGNDNFYYTSSIMNCIYDCEYCYLQGMYPSANIVIFVNVEDVFEECRKLMANGPLYICISYDTDLLALEGITGFVHKWIKFVSDEKDITVELRTKSESFKSIEDMKATDNFILAWTLSPEEFIENFEGRTPALQSRIESVKKAIENGWKVRLCFDPLLYMDNWKNNYEKFIDYIFEVIPINGIVDVSIGVFRVAKEYLKNMERIRGNSKLLAYPFTCSEGVCTYSSKDAKEITSFVYERVLKYIERERIYI